MAGQTYEGQTFGPYYTFDEGNIFIGCTFYAPVDFGEGCVFINCNWQRCCYPYYTNPYSKVTDGGVVDGGYWDYVTFSPNVTLKSGGGGSYSMGGGSTLDNVGRSSGRGGNWTSGGHIVMGGDYLDMANVTHPCGCQLDWDKEVREKGYMLLNKEQDDAGTEVKVPEDLIICKEQK